MYGCVRAEFVGSGVIASGGAALAAPSSGTGSRCVGYRRWLQLWLQFEVVRDPVGVAHTSKPPSNPDRRADLGSTSYSLKRNCYGAVDVTKSYKLVGFPLASTKKHRTDLGQPQIAAT